MIVYHVIISDWCVLKSVAQIKETKNKMYF